ncbi:MAG: hypothetical protein HFI93_05195 [Lachnospiraceae bacterium]|nr:hypothetical protein [Lachnospiraceae bacterium]
MNKVQERLIKDVLRRLGSNNSYQGFRYVIHCVAMVLEEDELMNCVKVLYVDAAAKYHTTQKCVERNIRTLSEIAWNGGYREILYEVAGYSLKERPTSREFIGILTNYVKSKANEREEEQQQEAK